VHSNGSLEGLRFLVCALCATKWHLVRIECVSCASTEGIAYFDIEGAGGLVEAETCDQCRTYSKIVFAEKDADAKVFADDRATPQLDILVDEAGWRQSTPSPFLLPGAC
jgi:FdhE protein